MSQEHVGTARAFFFFKDLTMVENGCLDVNVASFESCIAHPIDRPPEVVDGMFYSRGHPEPSVHQSRPSKLKPADLSNAWEINRNLDANFNSSRGIFSRAELPIVPAGSFVERTQVAPRN